MEKLFFNSLAAVQEVLFCIWFSIIAVHFYASTDVNKANGGNKYNAYRMINRGCTGVEKKLIECPRYL